MGGWQALTLLVLTTICSFAQAQNDPPTFLNEPYAVELSETVANETVVQVSIEAIDPDGVQYSITEGGNAFAINATSGEVTVKNTELIDYETSPSITVVIVATDENANPESSSATLTISLVDENDNFPIFDAASYSFSVIEEESNVVVGTIQATDADADTTLIYAIKDTTLSDFVLTTENNIATLKVTSKLDFEEQTFFSFVILVSDGLNSVETLVNVSVIDIIDQRPVITPVTSDVVLDFDQSQQSADMSHLTVTDDDKVYRGTAELLYLEDDSEQVRS